MFVENDFNAVDRPFDLSRVPWVQHVELLRWSDYWDGPLSGLVLHADEPLWFQIYFGDDIHGWDHLPARTAEQLRRQLVERGIRTTELRIYLLHRLTEPELREERYWSDLFEQHVQCAPETTRGKATVPAEWAKFYEPYRRERPTLDLAAAPVVAVWTE